MIETEKKQRLSDMACFWYAIRAYQTLSYLSREMLVELCEACTKHTEQQPVWDVHTPTFHVPHIEGPQRGLQIVVYLAVGTDLLSGSQLADRGMSFKWLSEAKKLYKLAPDCSTSSN